MTLSANDIGAAQALYGTPLNSAAAITSAPAVPPAAPAAPLKLTLNAPPASTQSNTMSVTGTVSGGTAPLSVQWQTDHGYSGQATLTNATNWTASGIALVNGSNTISVTAFDSNHLAVTQSATVSLTAAAQPAPSTGTSASPASTTAQLLRRRMDELKPLNGFGGAELPRSHGRLPTDARVWRPERLTGWQPSRC